MPQVHTVQGAIDAGELGIVLAHEHVRFRDETDWGEQIRRPKGA